MPREAGDREEGKLRFLKENSGFFFKKKCFSFGLFENFSLEKLKIEIAKVVLHVLKKFLEKTKKFFRKVDHHFLFVQKKILKFCRNSFIYLYRDLEICVSILKGKS